MACLFPTIFIIEYPPIFQRFLAFWSFVNLDFISFVANTGCYVRKGFHFLSLFVMTIGLIGLVVLVIAYFLFKQQRIKARKGTREEEKELKRGCWTVG